MNPAVRDPRWRPRPGPLLAALGLVTLAAALAARPGLSAVGAVFNGPTFEDDHTLTSQYWAPPSPSGAAGIDRLVAAIGSMIEIRSKAGVLIGRNSLHGFFGACGTNGHPFDPRVIWDHHAGRFVVVALERVDAGVNPGVENASRLLLAVSRTAAPAATTAADWWFTCINARFDLGGFDYAADHPALAVDEEALYVTADLVRFAGAPPAYGGSRLWIVHKGIAGGFYAGSPATRTVHDPYAAAGIPTTTLPAMVFGVDGAGLGIGTFLVSYSGLTDGVSEFAQVMRVDDPLGGAGGPFFVGPDDVDLGDLELLGADLPEAPQSGGGETIGGFDRRACDAVWRNGRLWMTTTIDPDGTALAALPDHTTAWWIELSTDAVTSGASPAGLIALVQQGGIPGEELAAPPGGAIFTFFPSVAVSDAGVAAFGFAASGSSIFCGAYATSREPADPPGFTAPASIVKTGRAYYVRTFDSPPCEVPPVKNRWGDYSSVAIDPTHDGRFWVFNAYAELRGSPTTGGCALRPGLEDGRWGTVWAAFGDGATLAIGDPPVADGKALALAVTPNPSGGPVAVEYTMPRATRARISVLDVQGHEVARLADGRFPAGRHRVDWSARREGRTVRAGIYFIRFSTPERTLTRRVAIFR